MKPKYKANPKDLGNNVHSEVSIRTRITYVTRLVLVGLLCLNIDTLGVCHSYGRRGLSYAGVPPSRERCSRETVMFFPIS